MKNGTLEMKIETNCENRSNPENNNSLLQSLLKIFYQLERSEVTIAILPGGGKGASSTITANSERSSVVLRNFVKFLACRIDLN